MVFLRFCVCFLCFLCFWLVACDSYAEFILEEIEVGENVRTHAGEVGLKFPVKIDEKDSVLAVKFTLSKSRTLENMGVRLDGVEGVVEGNLLGCTEGLDFARTELVYLSKVISGNDGSSYFSYYFEIPFFLGRRADKESHLYIATYPKIRLYFKGPTMVKKELFVLHDDLAERVNNINRVCWNDWDRKN